MSNVSGRAAACQTAATLLTSEMYVSTFVDAMADGQIPGDTDIFKYTVAHVERYIRTGEWIPKKEQVTG